jgi:hypothetical protein
MCHDFSAAPNPAEKKTDEAPPNRCVPGTATLVLLHWQSWLSWKGVLQALRGHFFMRNFKITKSFIVLI